jgi:hypothetical protein
MLEAEPFFTMRMVPISAVSLAEGTANVGGVPVRTGTDWVDPIGISPP